MNLTDAEARVLAIVLQEVAVQTGEDLMGVFLKETGHRILDGAGIVALATKLENVLIGQPCFACDGIGVFAKGKGYEHDCHFCNGEGTYRVKVGTADE